MSVPTFGPRVLPTAIFGKGVVVVARFAADDNEQDRGTAHGVQQSAREGVRHLPDRRGAPRQPARVRGHAAHRPGVWGDPKDPDEAVRVLRRAVELGVNVHRHRRLVRPVRHRAADPRGAAPVRRRPGDRHQGRAHPAPAPATGVRSAAPSTCASSAELSLRHLGARADRPLPAAPHRPAGAAGGPARRAGALQDEGKVRHIGLSEVSVDEIEEAARDRHRSSSVQNLYNLADRQRRGRARPLRGATTSRSSRGSRSPPASWPGPAARWTRSPTRTARRRRSWRSPGCCAARR